ncbi:integrase [Pseudomonas fluorescens group sp. PF-69]
MQNQSSLSFLTQAVRDPKEKLRKVWWLLSDFDAPVWSVSLDYKTPDTIDWGVTLDDQSLLTDEKNKKLFTSLRYFLAASTENLSRKLNRAPNSIASQRQDFNTAIHVIDSILMNAQQFELARYGLAGINKNNLKQLLYDYSASNSIAESVYKFSTKASIFCLQLTLETPRDIIENILQTTPSLSDISESILEESKFEFSTNVIPSIRAALLFHGYYIGHNAAGYTVNTARIAKNIYPNTLRKQVVKSRIHILSFYPEEPAYRRELPAVPVRSTVSDGITLGVYSKFRQKLCSLGILHALDLDAPPHADLLAIEQFTVELLPTQRYRLVPSEVIFDQLKNCIEFHFKYGRLILDGYCKLARHCMVSGLSMDVLPIEQFQNIIGPELTSIGVTQLGLACRNRSDTDGTGKKARKLKKRSFYTNLRANKGLLELISIYIGCVQFVVGVLMARRSVELIELPALKCLDKTMEWLIIDLAKTSQGLWGLRDKQARPIDQLGVQMIRELQRMQRYLKKIGFIDKYTTLFATPNHLSGMILPPASIFSFSRNLDFLFDYFEIPTNKSGQRYYIRQHQLRRFFALLFFHFFDGARINGLRWHLGHADITHVWHYINQVVDGASLRGARAQYVVEKIMRGKQKNYTELAEFFEKHYGISDFTLVDDVQADKYIQDLLKKGNLTVEPEFFTDENGTKMEVIVKIVHI